MSPSPAANSNCPTVLMMHGVRSCRLVLTRGIVPALCSCARAVVATADVSLTRWRSAARGLLLLALLLLAPLQVEAGGQIYEPLSNSVQTAMAHSVSDGKVPELQFDDPAVGRRWLFAMSARLAPRIRDTQARVDLLKMIHYEATRAGLDPQMVLGLIEVESAFHRYAISRVGARGLMQVMPFWVDLIGAPGTNLFNVRTNLRFGCVIMRHYLDIEKGNLANALARYNGSLGRSEYPTTVMAAARHWQSPVDDRTRLASQDQR